MSWFLSPRNYQRHLFDFTGFFCIAQLFWHPSFSHVFFRNFAKAVLCTPAWSGSAPSGLQLVQSSGISKSNACLYSAGHKIWSEANKLKTAIPPIQRAARILSNHLFLNILGQHMWQYTSPIFSTLKWYQESPLFNSQQPAVLKSSFQETRSPRWLGLVFTMSCFHWLLCLPL